MTSFVHSPSTLAKNAELGADLLKPWTTSTTAMNSPSHTKLPEDPSVRWWDSVKDHLDRLLLSCLRKTQPEPVQVQCSYPSDKVAVDLDINEKPQLPSDRCREWVEAASMWRLEIPPPPPLKPGLNPIFLGLLTPPLPPPVTNSTPIKRTQPK